MKIDDVVENYKQPLDTFELLSFINAQKEFVWGSKYIESPDHYLPVYVENLSERSYILNGEEVIHTNNGLHFKMEEVWVKKFHRVSGLHQGKGWISDDFNDPLDEFFDL